MAMTDEARTKAIERAMQAFAEPGSSEERIPLPYKDGKEGPFPVIKVPTDAVLFNHRSHRIRAQLESHPKREIVANEPHSDEAQDVIQDILAATEGYEALKSNLSEYGQRDAGVVTRRGLLVNANTRLATLRDLEVDYIRCALLPSDADDNDIDRLELELQVQRDFKQDYTFTNELIFINELLESGYTEEKAAKALMWAASSDEKELKRGIQRVRQSGRLYGYVRSIQSLGGDDNAIPLTFFDDKRQALIDLDDKYEAMQGSDPEGADRMKYARIAGILSGNYYRELRRIDGDSVIDNLVPLLEEKEALGEEVPQLVAPPEQSDDEDADLLGGEDEEEAQADLLPLVKLIAESHTSDEIELPSGKKVARDEILQEIAEAIEETAEEVQSIEKASKSLTGPIRHLEDALKKAKAAAVGYRQFHNAEGFKNGKFKYHANKLKVQLAAIEKMIEQHDET